MALRDYQQTIALNTLYLVRKHASGSEQLQPSLESVGGVVTAYGSQTLPSAPPADMQANLPFEGIAPFNTIPNYLYVTQTSGTTTDLVLSGISAEVV